MITLLPPSRTPVEVADTQTPRPSGKPPWWLFACFLAAALLVLSLFGWSVSSSPLLFMELLVAAGAISFGSLLGFLFGMPRSPFPTPAAGPEESGSSASIPYQPSNNLEQVSDWLTKILIGVGLVELRKIAGALSAMGLAVANSLKDAPPVTSIVTQVVVVTFLVLGFLASFLWTRIYYGPLQTLADNDVINRLRIAVEEYKRRYLKQQTDTKKVTSIANELALGTIPTPASTTATAKAPAKAGQFKDIHDWPAELQDKIKKFAELPPEWDRDPAAESAFFSKAPREINGCRLDAELEIDLGDALVIRLRVQRLTGEPILGPVVLLLHPTFPEKVLYISPDGDKAETTISSSGWFTVVAILDKGETVLAYDLKELPNVPAWFKACDPPQLQNH